MFKDDLKKLEDGFNDMKEYFHSRNERIHSSLEELKTYLKNTEEIYPESQSLYLNDKQIEEFHNELMKVKFNDIKFNEFGYLDEGVIATTIEFPFQSEYSNGNILQLFFFDDQEDLINNIYRLINKIASCNHENLGPAGRSEFLKCKDCNVEIHTNVEGEIKHGGRRPTIFRGIDKDYIISKSTRCKKCGSDTFKIDSPLRFSEYYRCYECDSKYPIAKERKKYSFSFFPMGKADGSISLCFNDNPVEFIEHIEGYPFTKSIGRYIYKHQLERKLAETENAFVDSLFEMNTFESMLSRNINDIIDLADLNKEDYVDVLREVVREEIKFLKESSDVVAKPYSYNGIAVQMNLKQARVYRDSILMEFEQVSFFTGENLKTLLITIDYKQ